MIGGYDVCFPVESCAQVAEGVIRIVRACWRDAVVENVETGDVVHVGSIGVLELPAELFIYKNAAARESWNQNGAIRENENSMVHVIRDEDSMTIVVDDPAASEIVNLIAAITEHVYQDIFWMRADAA